MKAILKQIAGLFLSLAVIYGFILAATYILAPEEQQTEGLNAGKAGETIYMTEPKYVFLNRQPLQSYKEKVVLLGASNTLAGFRNAQLQPLVKNAVVDNLGIGGSNITQLAQAYDLVREVQDDTAQHRTIYVIGIWYGEFVADAARWYSQDRVAGDTDLDIERYRYGFWRRSADGPVRVVQPAYLSLATDFIRPSLLFDQLIRNGTTHLREYLHHPDKKMRTDEERNATVFSDEDKRTALLYWHDSMKSDTLADEQFQVLDRLLEKITAAGNKVLVVELPLPRWHVEGSPYYKTYADHMRDLVQKFQSRPGFYLLNMQDMNDDRDYSDEVHPKPRVTLRWSQRLAKALNPIIMKNISADERQTNK